MSKRFVWAILLVILIIFSANCAYYKIIHKTGLGNELNKYKVLSIGWLDLGEGKWRTYGFDEDHKEDWQSLIVELNLKSFPRFLKFFLPLKTIFTTQEKSQEPRKEGLRILFTDVNYVQRTSSGEQIVFGSFGGSDTLNLFIHFIDAQSGHEVGQVSISVQSKAGSAYSSYGFEGRVTNSVYNLARYLGDILRGSPASIASETRRLLKES